MDMIERAADAISAANNDAPCADIPPDLAGRRRKEARAALLAALDLSEDAPSFRALVTALAIADDGHPDGLKYRELAKAALSALHSHIAQGETLP